MPEPPDPRPSPSGGDATREAVEAVLRDQEERRRRRARPRRPGPRSRAPLRWASLVLAGLSVSVWTHPPGWVRPPPFPAPGPARMEAGLRMDMWVAVQRIRGFQDRRHRLPVTLREAIPEARDTADLSYQRLSTSAFRLVGRRQGIDVTYDSGTPAAELSDPALSVIRGGGRR